MADLAKHREFESWASVLESRGAERFIEKNARGIKQHVVRSERALLRWPVRYEHGAPKVRYGPLQPCSIESDLAAIQVRKELGL